MNKHIITVANFNIQQDKNYISYLSKCKDNNIEPQNRNCFNDFLTFDYKSGFVMEGLYPIYKKRRKDFN